MACALLRRSHSLEIRGLSGLSACPPVINHQCLTSPSLERHLAAKIRLYQRQRKIDPCAHSGPSTILGIGGKDVIDLTATTAGGEEIAETTQPMLLIAKSRISKRWSHAAEERRASMAIRLAQLLRSRRL